MGKLIWMDMEMTGLNPESDRIIEIATLVTSEDLEILEEGPVVAIHQSDVVLEAMDDWNQTHHAQSGLLKRVRASQTDEATAETETLAFVRRHVQRGGSPLCGNTIWQDRRFLARHMPALESWLHYRNIDVSSVKELVRRWYPSLTAFQKSKGHTALADIRESIGELQYYRQTVFREAAQVLVDRI